MPRFFANPYLESNPVWDACIARAFESDDVTDLHRSIEEYQPTPLIVLPGLAREFGVGRIVVKDESHRFGLKAFKALGATYAIYRSLREYFELRGHPLPAASEFYRSPDILPPDLFTFCTATDGNHGRGVAWTARKLRQKAVIYMPADTVEARIENIRGEGAEVIVVDGTYDEAVTRCASDAELNGWKIISDTSWPGYSAIPGWIMAGYLTLFREIEAAVENDTDIDLVIIQGGVGALAGAAAWYFRELVPSPGPRLVTVEPIEAACLLESIESPGGQPVLSRGRQNSIMAGLNCGLPSPVAWPLIKLGVDGFLAVDDDACVKAMRRYYRPASGDPRIISGESGAAGLAALLTLMREPSLAGARESLGLGRSSSVLLLNTEGDTDPESFERLVRSHNL